MCDSLHLLAITYLPKITNNILGLRRHLADLPRPWKVVPINLLILFFFFFSFLFFFHSFIHCIHSFITYYCGIFTSWSVLPLLSSPLHSSHSSALFLLPLLLLFLFRQTMVPKPFGTVYYYYHPCCILSSTSVPGEWFATVRIST